MVSAGEPISARVTKGVCGLRHRAIALRRAIRDWRAASRRSTSTVITAEMSEISSVGLSDRERNTPGQLSGRQQQRVAIARALINAPSLLLADEPTGNLDMRTSHEIMETLVSLNREQGVTIILVTHEADIAACADRIVTMRDGRIVSDERAEKPSRPAPAGAAPAAAERASRSGGPIRRDGGCPSRASAAPSACRVTAMGEGWRRWQALHRPGPPRNCGLATCSWRVRDLLAQGHWRRPNARGTTPSG